jgi:hypothetical protein
MGVEMLKYTHNLKKQQAITGKDWGTMDRTPCMGLLARRAITSCDHFSVLILTYWKTGTNYVEFFLINYSNRKSECCCAGDKSDMPSIAPMMIHVIVARI